MTGPILWTGIAIAAALALLALWAWLWPRARSVSVDERIRAIPDERWQAEALVIVQQCCDLHNRNCEPPSELCCDGCTETEHPSHQTTVCIAPDLSGPFDVIAEPDRRRAEHMNRTLRRVTDEEETSQ